MSRWFVYSPYWHPTSSGRNVTRGNNVDSGENLSRRYVHPGIEETSQVQKSMPWNLQHNFSFENANSCLTFKATIFNQIENFEILT